MIPVSLIEGYVSRLLNLFQANDLSTDPLKSLLIDETGFVLD